MDGSAVFFLTFAIFGGLALFIFGMQMMTDGLCRLSGAGLRTILTRATRNRVSGIGFGTVMGTLVHSSATTVMLVGFVNAGLIRLEQSAAVVFGANIGTSLSMQAISFKIDQFCWFAIAMGLLTRSLLAGRRGAHAGTAVLGFGMLFLGMSTMSGAIYPHREALAPYLTQVDGGTLAGCLTGILVAALLTAIWQSSGATIAFCFALISAGVFTRLDQVLPIVLGAHIGTCGTALLGSIGTHIEARRCACIHLLFNLVNVALAVVLRKYIVAFLPYTADDLLHQTANLHTLVMLGAALLLLPVAHLFAKATRILVPSRTPPPESSYLDTELLKTPERALAAVIMELQRMVRLAAESLRLNVDVLVFKHTRRTVQHIRLNEKVIDDIKVATREYLTKIADRYLSRRQTLLLQHLDKCIVDIERIGDHVEFICDLSLKRQKIPNTMVDTESWETLFRLYQESRRVLDIVIRSLDPANNAFQDMAEGILAARDHYFVCSVRTREDFLKKVEAKEVGAVAAMHYVEYINAFDRIVKHARSIALAEKHPEFWIKRTKQDRVVEAAPIKVTHELADPDDFLDRLQKDEFR